MKRNILVKTLWAISLLSVLMACEKDDEKEIEKGESLSYSALIINQGNYSEANGSLSTLNNDGTISNRVYDEANGGALASIIESAVDCGNYWALLCNSEDKVVIVNKNDFKHVATYKQVGTPRYGAYKDGVLYTTSSDFTNVVGCVFSIDLANAKVDTLITTNGGVYEGILYSDGAIWTAFSEYDATTWSSSNPSVCKYDVLNSTTEFYELDPSLTLSAKHLAVDNSGKIWVSCSAYGFDGVFASVDKSGKKLYKEADVKSFDYAGHIYFNGGKLFYMSSADGANYDVNAFDVTNKEVKKIASGEGFYGIGVDPNNGDVYAANVNGFTTNSSLYVFDKNGNMKIDGELVGVGACRFLFP